MIEIVLTKGEIAIVDDCDSDLAAYRWYSSTRRRETYTPYAAKSLRLGGIRRVQYLHRIIAERFFGDIAGLDVDHLNGNGLDNRRFNLRVVTHAENNRNRRTQHNNTSGFPGVSWFERDGNWRARIVVNGKEKHLGYFETPALAYEKYLEAAQARDIDTFKIWKERESE